MPTVALLIVLGFVLVVALGPLIAVPVAATSRWRLAIVDRRPAGHARRMPGGGVAGWLRARYADPAAWREAGYACLLATVVPAASVAALCTLFLGGIFLISPVTLALIGGRGYVALFSWRASTVPQSVPFFFAGLVLLVLWSYLVTLVAGADAAVTRSLLFGGGPEERLRAELTEVAASRARLAGAFEAERRRIERDLHDGAQQKLVALTMQLGLARLDLPPGPAALAVTAAHEQARQLMADLRDLIHGIQPQVLTELGLPAALSELADQAPVPVTVYSGLTWRLPGQAENTAYFAAAEALTNVAKHSGASSASVTARAAGGILVLEVRDDGRGGADPATGSGLTGLADRVAVAGGRMLLSSPPGGPTVLRVEIPCKNTSS